MTNAGPARTSSRSDADRLWAKSAGPKEKHGETLLRHTHNVVQVLADLRQLRPDLATRVNMPEFWHLAFWACVLHDFGKAATGFQQQVKPGGVRWGKRHEVLSLAFLDWLLPGLTHANLPWVGAAIASHHKDRSEIKRRYPLGLDPEDDPLVDMVAELTPAALDELWEILTVHAPRWRQEYGFDKAGVRDCVCIPNQQESNASIMQNGRDRIAEALQSFFDLAYELEQVDARQDESLRAVALRGTIITADHQASAHAFGLHPLPPYGREELLQRLKLTWQGLHQHQRDAANAHGSAILTAPTGSGKTEAALLWARNQGGTSPMPRLFYVLPFQASMNAMRRRLERTYPHAVGLQHGRSLHALYRQLLNSESTPDQAERLARREDNLAQLQFHPVRVLSPYQILKACYRLRGYEAILADLYGGLFILDEIHAYEPKRLALILKMLEHLRRHYGALFFVMTATLPALVREALKEALEPEGAIMASSDLYREYQRHTLRLLEGDLLTDGLAPILSAVREGQSVLVCCNTVRRAQMMWRQLARALEGNIAVELLHSGFNARDRLGKEDALLASMTAGATRTKQVVLVATQVVEVSLNIDFDTLFTDPAPLEALLQRFGRVNRLGTRGLAPVHVFTQPHDGQHVYDPALVQATLRVLRTIDGDPIDESRTGVWLDDIYAGDSASAWRESYRSMAAEFEATCIADLHAFQSNEELEELFYQAFDAVEVLPVSLEAEFQTLREEQPLDADSLLVSIRSSRYYQLRRAGKVLPRTEPWPRVVDVPYSPEMGLSTANDED